MVGLLGVSAAAWLAVHYVVVARDRGTAATVVQAYAAVAALVAPCVLWLWRRRTGGGDVLDGSLPRVADVLAEQVHLQWSGVAAARRLITPTPVPVRWRWSALVVTGPVTEAVGDPGGSARFAPLPGLPRVTAPMVAEGGLWDLFSVYGGLDSGRLIVLGSAGAGKSGAAIRLVLDALVHRDGYDDATRARIPVPVLLTLQGWDPQTHALVSWLAERMASDYPVLGAHGIGRDVAARLLRGGLVAVILDGLDEVPETARALAMRALDEQATFRLAVFSRGKELAVAAARGHVTGAAALDLQPVSGPNAADYLERCLVHPLPQSWRDLLVCLRNTPDAAVTTALDNPLMLTLVRDTYRATDPVEVLMDAHRFPEPGAIEDHLLERVLSTAYAPQPGSPLPRYTADQAERWLGFIAHQLNDESSRDLIWWRISRWKPNWPRILATAAIACLVFGLAAWHAGGLLSGPMGGLTAGPIGGMAVGVVFGRSGGAGLLTGALYGRAAKGPQRLRRVSRSVVNKRNLGHVSAFGLVFAVVSAAGGGLAGGLTQGPYGGIVRGLVGGLIGGAALGLFLGIGSVLARIPDETGYGPLDPVACWRGDRLFANIAGVGFGLVGGFASSVLGLTGTLEAGLVSGLAVGLLYGLVYPETWTAGLAFVQLGVERQCPVRLMRFLEDAKNRNVLRTVGPVYQFRHARLQDLLATAYARNHSGT